MKKIQVDKCPACYALDSAVAIAQRLHIDNLAGYWKNDAGKLVHPACIGCDGTPTWHPSGDIRAASELMETDRLFVFPVHLDTPPYFGWFAGEYPYREGVEFSIEPELELRLDITVPTSDIDWDETELTGGTCAFADTAPLAIVRAFLKSRGIEEIEVSD